MTAPVTLKVTNKSPRQPVKKLPATIQVTETTTVQDVKDQLSRLTDGRSPHRFGLFDPEKKKTLKDRKALILQIKEVASAQEILVKDLGPQLSWKTVFIIEYLGPLLIHLLFPFVLRPYVYGNNQIPPLSYSQYLSSAMIVLHFLKRELETLFVHKFSLSTMPIMNIFKNSAHYWIGSGIFIAYFIYHPNSYTQRESPLIDNINLIGLVTYIFGELSNAHTHITLSRLRSKGGTERGVPRGYGFNLVTCPNYLFEVIAWIGINIVNKSLATAIFTAIAWAQMHVWALKKEKALRAEFPDTYKKKKHVIVPLF
ncbi:putative enoyl reductase [Erysiphe necator]|uniref:Putative 3-oxo-5-alpha-steroid 4-dehydrogenase n=1 Tax=Uncinula necator TaxID=52586 RepID=A0A0B1P7U5_UNCNE|nr:putative enoyl reductase [Erysiphe necator]KHJ34288.1 putative 3-oxo-5-alpha-steroid 4-dehydrogenase [Erysiphe necator]